MSSKKSNTTPNIKSRKPLTPKQELFCRKYVETGYAYEAYKMAYDTSNMKPASVYNLASRLLNKVEIRCRISEIEAEFLEAAKIDQVKVMETLYAIVQCDPADMYDLDEATGKTRVKTPRQLPKRLRQSIKTIRLNRGNVTYDFNSKTEAARVLASMAGWEKPKEINNHVFSDGGRAVIDFNLPDDEEEK